jgi:hypothetical protein
MSRAFEWLNWERSLVVVLITVASVATPFERAVAQQPTQPINKLERYQYFYSQRAYPFNQIPAGALQRARQDYQRKWGSSPAAPPPFNQSLWKPFGPAPIQNVGFNNVGSGIFNNTGRINSIAVHPTNPNRIYIGAAAGGVWRSDDGGTTWNALTDTQCGLAIGMASIAIDPVNPNIVYAGTGEPYGNLDAYLGCGVLRSTDGGTTWTQLGGQDLNQLGINKLVIDPTTAGSTTTTKIFVATTAGLAVSPDSGATWIGLIQGSATDVVIDPSNTNNVYAAMDGRVGNDGGVWKSTTGGGSGSFNKIMTGLPTVNVGRIALAIAPSSPSTLYASIHNAATDHLLGVFQTINGGTRWNQVTATGASCSPLPTIGQCWYDMYLAVDPTNANTVYFGGVSLYKSIDGAATFNISSAGIIHVDQHAFAFQPGNASIIFAGNDGGIYKSTNGGVVGSWTSLNSNDQDVLNTKLAITQFYPGFAVDPLNVARALGGTQDNGVVLYEGGGGLLGWPAVPPFGDGGYGAIDFNAPETAYNAGNLGPFRTDDLSNLQNATWTQKTNGITLADRKRFIPPLVMSPTNSQTLYFGTYRLYKTTNRGDNWNTPSPDLTLGPCGVGNDNACSITAIAEAKSNSQVVYAGTSDAQVQVTVNGGTNWTPRTTGLPNRVVTDIAIDPTNANNAFVTFSGFQAGHVFKTTNGGMMWNDITNNLPDIPVNAIVLDPTAPAMEILIGTDLGVFRSHDGGMTWTPFNAGLPNTPVLDLVFNSSTGLLVAATHGRGAFTATISTATVTASHDFNNDGVSDILWRNTSGTLAFWLMQRVDNSPNPPGTAILSATGAGTVTTDWSVVGQRDFNGDGFADILWRNTNGQVAMWFMNGATLIGGGSPGTVTTDWIIAGTGDFNGDGKGDILWRNTTTGQVAMWMMNGTTILPDSGSVGTLTTDWVVAGTGDFNGDGKWDILWRNTTTGQAAIWLMNGTTIVSAAGIGTLTTDWIVAGTGDFNGDRKSDIVWRNTTTGQVAMWFMSGVTVSSAGSLPSVPTIWSIAETGDFNGDGMSDLLWRDTSGNTAVWLMNGATLLPGSGSLGFVDPIWTIQGMNAD